MNADLDERRQAVSQAIGAQSAMWETAGHLFVLVTGAAAVIAALDVGASKIALLLAVGAGLGGMITVYSAFWVRKRMWAAILEMRGFVSGTSATEVKRAQEQTAIAPKVVKFLERAIHGWLGVMLSAVVWIGGGILYEAPADTSTKPAAVPVLGPVALVKGWADTDAQSIEEKIRFDLSKAKGRLLIHGWDSKAVGPDTHLVLFRFDQNGGKRGYAFEVNSALSMVRDVFSSDELVRHYGFPISAIEASRANDFIKFYRERYPNDPRSDYEVMVDLSGSKLGPELFRRFPDLMRWYLSVSDPLLPGYRLELPTVDQFIAEWEARE